MRDSRRQIDKRRFYRVVDMSGRGFRCEVDDCEFDGVVEVESTDHVGITTIACYMCISFAIEDLQSGLSEILKRDRLNTIKTCKQAIGEHLKNGFEYD